MTQPHIIPTISIKDKGPTTIVDLNKFRYLDNAICDYQLSHRRWLPAIIVYWGDGTSSSMSFQGMDGADMIYGTKNNNIILTYC